MADYSASSTTIGGLSLRSLLLSGASLAGSAFIGYCVYFDYKRRSDPMYKQKIRARRLEARKKATGAAAGGGEIPIPRSAEEFQAFFLQEVQIGEELLSEGRMDEGALHVANAIALCGRPRQLLTVFEQSLPEPVFQLVVKKLPAAQMRLQAGIQAMQRMEQQAAASVHVEAAALGLHDDDDDDSGEDPDADDDDDAHDSAAKPTPRVMDLDLE